MVSPEQQFWSSSFLSNLNISANWVVRMSSQAMLSTEEEFFQQNLMKWRVKDWRSSIRLIPLSHTCKVLNQPHRQKDREHIMLWHQNMKRYMFQMGILLSKVILLMLGTAKGYWIVCTATAGTIVLAESGLNSIVSEPGPPRNAAYQNYVYPHSLSAVPSARWIWDGPGTTADCNMNITVYENFTIKCLN